MNLPDVGHSWTRADVEAQPDRVRRLYHLPTEVNELTLTCGGTVRTNQRTANHQCATGDSWVWTDDGDNWIVEGAKLPGTYADYETWKAAVMALIARVEGSR